MAYCGMMSLWTQQPHSDRHSDRLVEIPEGELIPTYVSCTCPVNAADDAHCRCNEDHNGSTPEREEGELIPRYVIRTSPAKIH